MSSAAAAVPTALLLLLAAASAVRYDLDQAKKEFNAVVKQIGELRKVCLSAEGGGGKGGET